MTMLEALRIEAGRVATEQDLLNLCILVKERRVKDGLTLDQALVITKRAVAAYNRRHRRKARRPHDHDQRRRYLVSAKELVEAARRLVELELSRERRGRQAGGR